MRFQGNERGNRKRLPKEWCREAESNHRHGDFQSLKGIRQFPTIFKPLHINHFLRPCWNTLSYVGLYWVVVVTIRLQFLLAA
jgi:hypothetical protein